MNIRCSDSGLLKCYVFIDPYLYSSIIIKLVHYKQDHWQVAKNLISFVNHIDMGIKNTGLVSALSSAYAKAIGSMPRDTGQLSTAV